MKKTLSVLLALALMLTTVLPFSASAATYDSQAATSNLYLEGTVEVVEIEGIEYQFSYYYEGSTRVIEISNAINSTVETVKCDELTGNIYLNGAYAGNAGSIRDGVMIAAVSTNGWESMSTWSHRISWAEGTTASIVASLIAAYLPNLGVSKAVAAIGGHALSNLASSSVGGVIYVDSQWYSVPPAMPQYRYVWSFTASSGDYYGLYVSHYSA